MNNDPGNGAIGFIRVAVDDTLFCFHPGSNRMTLIYRDYDNNMSMLSQMNSFLVWFTALHLTSSSSSC